MSEKSTPMEPRIVTTDSVNQEKAKPPKESVRSILTSPRYWLTALLPIIGIVVWFFIFFDLIVPYYNPGDQIAEYALRGASNALDFFFTSLLVEAAISFTINIFLPFTTNFRRAIFLSLPMLVLIIILLIVLNIDSGFGDIYATLIMNIMCGIPALILIIPIVVFGWLGAISRTALSRKAKS